MKHHFLLILALLLSACSSHTDNTQQNDNKQQATPLVSLVESLAGDNNDLSDILYLNKASDELGKYVNANIGKPLTLVADVPMTLKSKNESYAAFETNEEPIANHGTSFGVVVSDVPADVMASLTIGDTYLVNAVCVGATQPGYNNPLHFYMGTIPMTYTDGCITKQQ